MSPEKCWCRNADAQHLGANFAIYWIGRSRVPKLRQGWGYQFHVLRYARSRR